ncbi:uncharacterized protein LOC125214930 [Salvia hispanica]|uniref:uncharacterized protein LOC125214930 n=1 Tax=Salvia hispanica TaxID=49212 RepID=UPI0020090D2E|nr:uncharacterized protein LOC125214930 [Salvia hispanica]XP_047972120.1 uncharacterized protein LOC125214930 [Salvia hispanica]
MECNRDEAVRAKEIAERLFSERDMKGAKKLALKAQNLYPELEGISQMVMTLEIYIAAEEEKLNGESNWYGVLGLTPLADDDSIKKQYRKLALQLHPDKNRSVGAEGAFQFIAQAWNLLSDKSMRTAYDQRCGRLFQQRNKGKNEGPSPEGAQNGFYNFANTAQKGNNSKRNPSAVPNPPRKKERHTFWTVCHRCKMQYEYLRMYLNHNLLCPNCHEAYFAVEINPPSSTKSSKIPQSSNSQRRKSQQASDACKNTHHATGNNGSNPNNFQWVPFGENGDGPSAVKAAKMVHQAYEKVKRERQKAQAAARKEEALRRKNVGSKRTMGGEALRNSEPSKRRKGAEDCGVNKDKMKQANCESGISQQVNISGCKQDNFPNCESSHNAIRHVDANHLVMEKARDEIQMKLKECISAPVVRNVTSEDNLINKKQNESSTKADILGPLNRWGFSSSDSYPDEKLVEQMFIDVLEPDFHDFDKSRTEDCFGANQVWAVYDDDDGMPRNYALIQNVISLNPFKVTISWLNSTTHSRLGQGSWFVSGFTSTYGEFGVGRHEICDSINCFSHQARWTKYSSKTILIYPRKGDVWALYRNWSPEWNELTEQRLMLKYDLVEVLEDCDEELGTIVIPLLKVAGFKAVFHQHFDPREIRRIPKEELSCFSHHVPSHLLTGQEGSKSPKGCLELDPAAIPPQFLQVMSDIETIELVESDEEIDTVKEVDCIEEIETGKAVDCIEEIETGKAVDCDEEMETVKAVDCDEEIETGKAFDCDPITNSNVVEVSEDEKMECP